MTQLDQKAVAIISSHIRSQHSIVLSLKALSLRYVLSLKSSLLTFLGLLNEYVKLKICTGEFSLKPAKRSLCHPLHCTLFEALPHWIALYGISFSKGVACLEVKLVQRLPQCFIFPFNRAC